MCIKGLARGGVESNGESSRVKRSNAKDMTSFTEAMRRKTKTGRK